MDNFKKTIMDSINSDLTTRGERPGPRLKQSVPSQSNLEDDLNDLTTTNKCKKKILICKEIFFLY